ncbi:MAG TPA: response regulator [Bdellovibrionota bacterium]|jgi:CheY-like chemotaxis protein
MSSELEKNARSVLVVEDDSDVRSSLGEFLSEEGYHVETAANGKEALLQLEKHKPGLVLLDLMMPVMNGWEFLEHKNKTPELSDVPVLVLSAVPGKPYVPGALACLKKPIDLQRLMDFVELYCA